VSNTDSPPEAQPHKSRPTLAAVIFGTVLRLLWAATAFCLAARVALVVLLGALPLISADLGTGRLRRRPLGSTGWV